MAQFHPAGARVMAQAFAQADLRDVLPTIDVPTLLLAATLDRRAPVATVRELARSVPGARLVLLEGVGHQSNMEVPDRFTEAVRTFLRTVPGGPAPD
jgi:pimeloyl-ACP methyl ester carboxylesterase